MKARQVFEFNEPVAGRRLQLQRLGPEHAHYLHDSFADEDFWAAYRSNQNRRMTLAELSKRLELESQSNPLALGKIEWVIRAVSSMESDDHPLGFAGLSAINADEQVAEFMLGIPRPAHRLPGTGLEASLLLFDYAFNRLRLRKLLSYVYAENETAQGNTLALGFSQTAFQRAYFGQEGESAYKDVFRNEMLDPDFRANRRLSKLSLRLLGRDVTSIEAIAKDNNRTSTGGGELQASFQIGE